MSVTNLLSDNKFRSQIQKTSTITPELFECLLDTDIEYLSNNNISTDCSSIIFDQYSFSSYIDSTKSIVYLIQHGVKIPTSWILNCVYKWYRDENLVSLLVADDIIGIRQVLSELIRQPKFILVLEALSHTEILQKLYQSYGLKGHDDSSYTILRTCLKLES
jgi:hypothetical protein